MSPTTPVNSKQMVHTNAFNLARRWSVQNENDLMMEDMFENPMNIGKPEYTHDACQEMAAHMMHAKSLPAECKKYKDVMSDLQRRDSDTTHPSQVLS